MNANVNCIVKKDGRCKYNVILESVRITIVVLDRQWVLYTECVSVALVTQHAVSMCTILYSPLKPDRVYRIFPHYFTNGMIFEKNNTQNVCFDFLYNFVLNVFRSKRNSAICYHKCTYVITGDSGQILIKMKFSRQSFEK